MQPAELEKLKAQVKVSKTLANGFIFSIVWLGGVGSLVALISGLRARKMIQRYKGELTGIGMAWWCIIVGSLGVIILLPLSVWTFIKLTR
ncbi:MAG TPA: hypothetical protein VF779_00390 [Pyrinomonadaceae bacterium]